MTGKIWRSVFFTSVLILLLSFAFMTAILYPFFEGQIVKELKSEANYAAYSVAQDEAGFFKNFNDRDRRVTLIAPDGRVLNDTAEDAEKLDNHRDRKEVQQALLSGDGTSIRYSDTLTEKTVYYAKRLENGNILRVSTRQYTIITILLSLVHPLLVVLILALLFSFLLSSRVAKSFIRPINNLDLDHPESNDVYQELSPLLRKIAAQKKTITKQLEDAGQKQKEFHLLTENMHEGFLVIDHERSLLSYNSAALRLLGADSAQHTNVLTLNRTPEFREVVDSVLNGKRMERSMQRGDMTYQLIGNPVTENQKVIGGIIIIFDITESAKRETLRREFTANVSHELKTPLTSISGFAELMKRGDTPPNLVVDFSNSIYDESQRLIHLVSDIIKISQLDENCIEYTNEDIDLYRLSDEVLKRLKSEAEKKQVTLSLCGESAIVHGAGKILDEMIFNLCDNALKYNRPGGSVTVQVTNTDGHAVLTVTDTGIGIPAAEQSRVFERFYRVDKARSKSIGGTGLGLSIVKHGAIYHNAEIKLKSTLGQGTCITISFPKTNETDA